jgi:hypothetical protein
MPAKKKAKKKAPTLSVATMEEKKMTEEEGKAKRRKRSGKVKRGPTFS